MSNRSLCVIIIPGWGVASSSRSNLFSLQKPAFLAEFFSTYPTLCLDEKETDLGKRYELMGKVDAPLSPLSALLSAHHIDQVRISDADRYSYLTQTFNHGQAKPFDQEIWEYVPFLPGKNMFEHPHSTTKAVLQKARGFLKQRHNLVMMLSLNAIWSVGLYGHLSATHEAIVEMAKHTSRFIHEALQSGFSVLLLSDGGMAEDYIELDQLAVKPKMTSSPVPCLFIDPKLEGLKSGEAEVDEAGQLLSSRSLPFSLLGNTIAKRMGIPVQGKTLFDSLLSRL